MPTLRRGMRVQRQGINAQCSVGPFFQGTDATYFLTVQHGVTGPGNNRVVEACFDGFAYTRVGTYITGIQDEAVDWAIVKIDPGITVDAAVPVGQTAAKFASVAAQKKLTAVGYNYQQGGPALFESADFTHGDLNGRVDNSPTFRQQYQCRTTGERRANSGDSGSAVFDQVGKLIGMEWAIEWDGTRDRHLFYAQPIITVAVSLIGRLWDLEVNHPDHPDWPLAKPISQQLGSDKARVKQTDPLVAFTLSLIH
ncbi:S1 family peptidase [Actinokineospora diospyrosa]|uniref:Trypsin-like peptidase domain-containing protein n=1 Tax=Actinokineospora diospyrosa TaxID=103728 RepID=A0ABT1I9J5_9PSEU|nr:serine protease [Actinokineospora diospyrosa]MCP2269308.1 Trypsin-like peptidase domain-containing protein [Actinokineospora diospyrosa]